jgi:hypothetical protein
VDSSSLDTHLDKIETALRGEVCYAPWTGKEQYLPLEGGLRLM